MTRPTYPSIRLGVTLLRQLASSLLTAAVAFAAVQLVVIPWLSAPPAPAGRTNDLT